MIVFVMLGTLDRAALKVGINGNGIRLAKLTILYSWSVVLLNADRFLMTSQLELAMLCICYTRWFSLPLFSPLQPALRGSMGLAVPKHVSAIWLAPSPVTMLTGAVPVQPPGLEQHALSHSQVDTACVCTHVEASIRAVDPSL